MQVYYDAARAYSTARLHPYNEFVDFVQHSDQIPVALEDFRPFSDRLAVQTFYDFLEVAKRVRIAIFSPATVL